MSASVGDGFFASRAAAAINCAPEESLVIEDAVSGVLAAKAARMKCIAMASNGRAQALREAGADGIVTDFKGLHLEAIRGLFDSIVAPS